MTKLLRRPQVEAITGLSRSSIYRAMDQDQFPRPVKIGQRAVAWREADLNAWLSSRTTT
jgi:prophage regulatory protein